MRPTLRPRPSPSPRTPRRPFDQDELDTGEEFDPMPPAPLK